MDANADGRLDAEVQKVGTTCSTFGDCLSGACVAGKCRCTNRVYEFNVTSGVGGPLTFGESPGGAQTQYTVQCIQ